MIPTPTSTPILNRYRPFARRDLFTLAAFALAYFAAHQIAFFFPDSEKVIMLIWPAGGVGLTAFLLSPQRLWPALTVVFYAAGISADVLVAKRSLLTGVGYMTGNMIESIGCTWLILRAGKSFQNFNRVREILALIMGALTINALSSCIGAGTSVMTRGASFLESWKSWYISDGLGVLVVGPFLVSWLQAKELWKSLSWRKVAEGVGFILLWSLVCLISFKVIDLNPVLDFHPYLLVGLIVWPALRSGQRGVTLSILLLFVIAAVSPSITNGPSPWEPGESTFTHRLLELQLFLGFLAVVGYFLAAGFAERLQAEKELREKERLLSMSQQIAHLGSWSVPLDEMTGQFSEEACSILGLPPENHPLSRDKFLNLIHVDDRPIMEKWIQDCMRGRHPSELEFRVVRPDGTIRILCGRGDLQPDEAGGPPVLVGSVQDVTERKLAEERLRASEEKYRAIFEQAGDYVLVLNLVGEEDLVIADANESACRFHGYLREELIGHSIRQLDPEVGLQGIRKLLPRLMAGEILRFETNHCKKDGTTFPVDVCAKLVQIAPEPPFVLSTERDITERRRAEEVRLQLEAQLRHAQRLEAVGQLAGGVAHDLNNLLTPILGYGEMLLGGIAEEDPARKPLQEIVGAGVRARDLVHKLLAFSRKQILQYKQTDLNGIIAGLDSLLRRIIPEDIHMTVIPSPASLPVTVDIGQIEQVIMNLAVNASDAMPNGGTMIIETFAIHLDETYAGERNGVKPGMYGLLAVSDTGHGMDQETRMRVFEPFFSTKGEQGTGLGMATAYGIVKQHGGNIWAYSEPGHGATFKVYLPLTEVTMIHPEDSTARVSATGQMGTETILLVEDNRQVLELSLAILSQKGYRVKTAANGQEALEVLERLEGTVDLLLTDVIMPEMNGKELYARAAEKHPGLKVLFMSGYTDNVIAQRGVLDQRVAFIQKPFSVKTLAAKVREVLDNG